MAYFTSDTNRYLSVRDRAVQRQRDEEVRVSELKKFSNDMVLSAIAVGRDDAVDARRRRAERETIAHEEMMEAATRTVSMQLKSCESVSHRRPAQCSIMNAIV